MDPLRSGAIFKLFPSANKRAPLRASDEFPLPPPPSSSASKHPPPSSSSAATIVPAKSEASNLIRSRFEDLYRATPLPPILASKFASNDSKYAQEMAIRPEEAGPQPTSQHRPQSTTPIHHDHPAPPPPSSSSPSSHSPHQNSASKLPSSPLSGTRSEKGEDVRRAKHTPSLQVGAPSMTSSTPILHPATETAAISRPPRSIRSSEGTPSTKLQHVSCTPAGRALLPGSASIASNHRPSSPHHTLSSEPSIIADQPSSCTPTVGEVVQTSGRKGKRGRSGADSLVLLLSSYSLPTCTTSESTDHSDSQSLPSSHVLPHAPSSPPISHRSPHSGDPHHAGLEDSVHSDTVRSGARAKERRLGTDGSLSHRPALLSSVDVVPWPSMAETSSTDAASAPRGTKRARSLTPASRPLSSPHPPSSGEIKRRIMEEKKKNKKNKKSSKEDEDEDEDDRVDRRAATRSRAKAKSAAATSSSAVSSSRQILATTLAARQARPPVQTAEWTRGEVIALYQCHAQTSINQPNFWEEVAHKMCTRDFPRSAEECEQRFYKVLEDRRHRRGKSIDEKRRERVQEVQAKLARMAARTGPQWKGPAERAGGEGEDVEDDRSVGDTSPVHTSTAVAVQPAKTASARETSRPRLTKQDLQVLSLEASKAKKEDDLFDRHPLQRAVALPASVAIPTTPTDSTQAGPPRALSLEASSPPRLFQSQRVHELKRRIQPTLLVAYDSRTVASKLQPPAGGAAGLGKKTHAALAALQGGLGGGSTTVRSKNRAVMGLLQRNLELELQKLPRDRGEEDDEDEESGDEESGDEDQDDLDTFR